MIIILEGCNGTGKTTLAKGLCSSLGIPAYKPFRTFGDGHWGGRLALGTELKRFKVPFNTVAEDLFMADFLARFRPDVLLDRSMPSGIAYGRPESGALEMWQMLLEDCPVVYIWLDASFDVARRHSPGRVNSPIRYAELRSTFASIHTQIQFDKIRINVDRISSDKVFRRAESFIEERKEIGHAGA